MAGVDGGLIDSAVSAMHRVTHGIEGYWLSVANRYRRQMSANKHRYTDGEKRHMSWPGIPVPPRLGRSVREWDWVRLEFRGFEDGVGRGGSYMGDGGGLTGSTGRQRRSGEGRILLNDDIVAVSDDIFTVTKLHPRYRRVSAG
jgi:hypothetical protein